MKNSLLIIGIIQIFNFLTFLPANAQNSSYSCPEDVEILTEKMLIDLPHYANRVIQRARRLEREVDLYSYVLLAGKPEFEPLELTPNQYSSVPPIEEQLEPPEQIFFTTLERQYINNKVEKRQNYHWLFLSQTEEGWRMSMVFSRFGSNLEKRPPTPPRETSDSVIGQAVSLWLRDCRAGVIK
ncbi:MAG: hypothetical protein WBG70_19250 [Spirulinaceae cyanobacterium]